MYLRSPFSSRSIVGHRDLVVDSGVRAGVCGLVIPSPTSDNPPHVGSFAFLSPGRIGRCASFAVASLAICFAALPALAQIAALDKGHQILIDRGMPIGGLVALTSDPFHLSTLQAGGFTIPMWAWNREGSN